MGRNETEVKALRRPFVRELFRGNRFSFAMTVVSVLLAAAANLVISWLLKEISNLISGYSAYGLGALAAVMGGAFALLLAAWALDRVFLAEFRTRSMRQYRDFVFGRLMEKGIRAFSGENTSLYISALSNDVNTIERDFVNPLQNTIQDGATFVGALAAVGLYKVFPWPS